MLALASAPLRGGLRPAHSGCASVAARAACRSSGQDAVALSRTCCTGSPDGDVASTSLTPRSNSTATTHHSTIRPPERASSAGERDARTLRAAEDPRLRAAQITGAPPDCPSPPAPALHEHVYHSHLDHKGPSGRKTIERLHRNHNDHRAREDSQHASSWRPRKLAPLRVQALGEPPSAAWRSSAHLAPKRSETRIRTHLP
jgi:hypothetical protein